MPSQLSRCETSSGRTTVRRVSRRVVVATIVGAMSPIARPTAVRAQPSVSVRLVQQRGLLYLPIDMMVSGGVLQKEADKLGLGEVDASVKTLSGPGPVIDAVLSGAADYGTAALPSLVTLWERTRGRPNEVRAVGTVSNGAMTLYTINPNVKTIADFTETDRIAVPTVGLSFNAMMLQMAAEKQWNDPHRLDHLTVSLGHPDAVAALSAGYGRAIITAHVAVQPYTEQGLKMPGAHSVTDSREVFGGTLTQIVLLATKTTRERNPTLFKAVTNALNEAIRVANADKQAAAVLWKQAQNAPDTVESLVHLLDDPGFEFTSQPHRITYFTGFLNRIGSMKTEVDDWRKLFWEPTSERKGDE
jgi:NitT/TauT family transport system substrate-binding protein